MCVGFTKEETNCAHGLDNDLDGKIDCADSNCLGVSCGSGCTCAAAGPTETNCKDGLDNDLDTKVDCADSDCSGKACTPGVGGCPVGGTCP